jgi:hypothetical protein
VGSGTTDQITIENFSRFVTAYSATTASNNFSGTQNITGNVSITGVETVTGTLNVVGGGSVSGNFSVGGKLTVQELHTELTSASVLFESGSTILGNTADDTHTVTGTILLNGQALGTGQLNAYTGSLISQTTLLSTFTTSINLATASLNLQTGSQDLVNRRISSTTGSINTTTSSFDSVFLRISSTTGSINTTTSSFNSVFLGISSVTGAMNTQSSSQDLVNLAISTYTGSQNIINSSVDSHILKQASQTGSQDLVNLGISSVTGSLIGITNGLMAFTSALDNTYATDAQLYQLYQATSSIQAFTSSQDSRNFTISQITSSIDAHILKQAIQTGSQDLVNLGISTFTGSQNVINNSIDAHILKQAIQTGSQDLVNLGISSVTGSLIGITNGLMAFTAALDSTYATDAQLYQLYQATASLNTQTGSQNTINFNISVVTSSIDAHILKQAIQTGSQDLVNLGISTYTGSQNVINTSVDSHILKQATQTGSQDLVNLGISTFTGSLRSEVNLIEAYTASLKNAFTIDGNNDVYFTGKITTQEVHTTYTTSSVLFQSGSTKFGNSSDDIHEFTGSKFEMFNSDTSGTMYAVVKNNRARNAAVKTTTTNGSFIAGTSIGTDAFQYQIYDEVEGVNRVTINSQGGTTLQGAVSASQTLRVTGKTQIGTSTVDTSLGSKTKLSVVGDGSVNAGASQGSLFVGAGNDGGDTGLPINMGTGGATMMLLASINTSTGTSTNSATYIVRFYFDGNNAPTTTYLGGSSDFVTFGVTPSNTLAVSGSSSGNKTYAWFINKFGA